MIPVILSGGSGTRLWPVSRKSHPKQFWPLVSDHSMLQETCLRLNGITGIQPPLVICNVSHRFFVAHQLDAIGIKPMAITLESEGRNTAPAVGIAALQAVDLNGDDHDPILLILPADHVIADLGAFHQALTEGQKLAEAGNLVTFGIVPTAAETGYGYIETGDSVESADSASQISRFVEKPDKETAQAYLDSGKYLWNSGMFMFRASSYVEALETLAPEMLESVCRAYDKATTDLDFTRLDVDAFLSCPADSIDYAVMERTKNGVVVPLDAGWNDVGSWSALWELGDCNDQGNVTFGDVHALDSRDCYLRADGRLLATVGVDNLIVVDTPDATMVASKDRVQDIKQLVTAIQSQKRTECDLPAEVHRPWGCYQSIDCAQGYQVKRISVSPGAKLSLQSHNHRAEHWIIVRGTARVTKGDEIFELHANESTYIPVGTKHRLENPGTEPLDIIEVQSGDYLGEDDIVRYEDKYGRTKM